MKAYILKGLFSTFGFSNGLDDLAGKLKAKGVDVFVGSYGDLDKVAREAPGKSRPRILIGHSQGANAAIRAADQIVPYDVDLLVTLCPVFLTGRAQVPYNVKRCLNFTSGIWGSYLAPGPGFKGSLEQERVPSAWHLNIDSKPEVHAAILKAVDQVRESAHVG